MTRLIKRVSVGEVLPPIRSVLDAQGIPPGGKPGERVEKLAVEAIALFREKAEPVGVFMEIGLDEFAAVFDGEGLNQDNSPIAPIYQSSDRLALFSVTIGQKVCAEISDRFGRNDFALGSMLDSAASEGTELTAEVIEKHFRESLSATGDIDERKGILRFSPGYCGWHISAQKKLFHLLRPDEIGITLNDSFLMNPIKSISGVIVMGTKQIFIFKDDFPFCGDCHDHPCRERMRNVFTQ